MDLWEGLKQECRRYEQRKPEFSTLYRIVSSCHEELALVWEEQFKSHYGILRYEVRDGFKRYLECGIFLHGCARAECTNPQCQHSQLLAFSCKRRCLCPSCDAKRAVIFAENLVQNVLLPYPHQHNVFTVPKIIRPYFRFDRKLCSHLYTAAWESWSELTEQQCSDSKSGAVMALHSAGDLLGFHPHLHGLFLSGATKANGTFVPLAIPQEKLQELFSQKVLKALVDEGLLSTERADMILGWPHSGFNVFCGEPIDPNNKERLLFSARYLKKCPISNQRLAIIETKTDTTIELYAFKDGVKSTRKFTPLEFLAELQQHIPGVWEQTSRFMGIYSARTRGTKTTQYDSPAIGPVAEPPPKPSQTWASLMKRVFEINPLLCRLCGAEMKIKAFITDPEQIQRLLDNLGIPSQRAPPKFKFTLPLAA